jgi:hypothetical protein
MSLPILEQPSAEERATMLIDARSAQNCLDWHKHCQGECCKQFSIPDRDFDLTKEFILSHVGMAGTADKIWYWKLHNCTFSRGYLKIPTKNCVRKNGMIYVLERCKLLTDDMKCKEWTDGRRPKICKNLTFENIKAKTNGSTYVTPRCLFKYQLALEEQYGTETSKE